MNTRKRLFLVLVLLVCIFVGPSHVDAAEDKDYHTRGIFCSALGWLVHPWGHCVVYKSDSGSYVPPENNQTADAPLPEVLGDRDQATTTVIQRITEQPLTQEIYNEYITVTGGGPVEEVVHRQLLSFIYQSLRLQLGHITDIAALDPRTDDKAYVTKEYLDDRIFRVLDLDDNDGSGSGGTTNNITNNYSTTTTATGDITLEDILADSLALGTTTARDLLTLDGGIYLDDYTPGDGTNLLYNVGGNLYWNGAILSSSTAGTLANLTDVSTAGVQTGNLLIYTGTSWATTSTSTLGISGGSSVSFGSNDQIPYINAGGTDYEYSDNLMFNGSDIFINGTSSASALAVSGQDSLFIQEADIVFENFTASTGNELTFIRGNGNKDAITSMQDGNIVYSISGLGYLGSGVTQVANEIQSVSVGNWTAGNQRRADLVFNFYQAFGGGVDEKFRFNSYGALGLTDSDPDFALEIATTTNMSGGSLGYLGISSSASEDGDIFIIDTNGNVGIGSTSPSSLLTVTGGVYAGGALRATGTVRFDALTDGLLLADSLGNLTAVATGTLGLNSPWTQNGTDLYYMGGDVGVGTNNPDDRLHISGGNLLLENTQSIRWENNAATANTIMAYNSSNDLEIGSGIGRNLELYGDNIMFFIDGEEKMRLDAQFDLGIGDTSPDLRLEIVGSSTDGFFGVSTTAGGDGDIFIVDGDGNVGIGSTSPSSKLAVNGGVRAATATAAIIDTGGQVCDVRAFGAVGDNSTINDDAIAAAIAACGEGGTVYFPMGQFRISQPIVLDTPITLRGAYSPRWSYSSTPRSSIRADFGSFAGVAMIHVRDRQISGETNHNNGGRLEYLSLDGGSASTNVDGIYFEGLVRDWKLTDVDISQVTGNGFEAAVGTGEGNPRGFTIRGLSIYSADGHGFRATALNDTYIDDLLAVGNALRGIYLSSMGETKVANSRAVFNALEGLYIDGASNNGGLTFTDFSTDRNDRHGVRISSTGTSTVVFNGLLTRRDGPNNGGGSETPYAGVAIIGSSSAKVAPVFINGLAQTVGYDDSGNPPLSPTVGVRVTNATYVKIDGQLWGVTDAYTDGGGNDWFIIEDDAILRTGTAGAQELYSNDRKWQATTTGLFYGGGRVSIGSTTASRLLNIVAPSNAGIRLQDTTNNVILDFRAEDFQGFFGTFSNHQLRLQTNNQSRMTIDTNGRVGIATTSPTSMLTVRATGTTDILNLFETGGVEVFTVLESGDVGIGITNPTNELHIAGTANTYAVIGTNGNTAGDEAGLMLVTLNGHSNTLGSASTRGWEIFGNSNANTETPNSLHFTYWNGTDWNDYHAFDSSGNVGIGTTSPGSTLDVWGDMRVGASVSGATVNGLADDLVIESSGATGLSILGGTANTQRIYFGSSVDNNAGQIEYSNSINMMTFWTGGVEQVLINSSGDVGIGTSTFAQKLTVAGNVRVGSSTGLGCVEDYDGSVIAGTCSSDESLKTNISPLAYSSSTQSILKRVVALTPVTYYWNEVAGEEYKKNINVANIGLIAQDVEEQFPELVSEHGGIKHVKFSALPFYLLEAIKELWQMVTGNQERIEELEARIEALESGESSKSTSAPKTGAPTFEEEDEPVPENEPEPEIEDETASTTPEAIDEEEEGVIDEEVLEENTEESPETQENESESELESEEESVEGESESEEEILTED